MKKGRRRVSWQGCSLSFCIELFLTLVSASVQGLALGAPLSLPILVLIALWGGILMLIPRDTSSQVQKGCLLPANCFILMGSVRRRWGDICLSKQGHPEVRSGLLVLGGSSWGAGNTSPPCQQLTNSHPSHYH